MTWRQQTLQNVPTIVLAAVLAAIGTVWAKRWLAKRSKSEVAREEADHTAKLGRLLRLLSQLGADKRFVAQEQLEGQGFSSLELFELLHEAEQMGLIKALDADQPHSGAWWLLDLGQEWLEAPKKDGILDNDDG